MEERLVPLGILHKVVLVVMVNLLHQDQVKMEAMAVAAVRFR